MKRAIPSLLLLGLGFAYLFHPLAHGLEKHPEICAVAQLEKQSPVLVVTSPLPVAPPVAFTPAPPAAPTFALSTGLTSPTTRGPPQA